MSMVCTVTQSPRGSSTKEKQYAAVIGPRDCSSATPEMSYLNLLSLAALAQTNTHPPTTHKQTQTHTYHNTNTTTHPTPKTAPTFMHHTLTLTHTRTRTRTHTNTYIFAGPVGIGVSQELTASEFQYNLFFVLTLFLQITPLTHQ